MLSAIADGRLDAATAVAGVMRASGDPLGALYEAVVALETGDEAGARRAAAESPTPLASRGPGARLARVLAARDAGVHTLVLDRHGELVAALGAVPVSVASAEESPAAGADRVAEVAGRDDRDPLVPEPDAAGLLPGLLERLPPLPETGAVRLTVDLPLSRAVLTALGDRRGSIVLVDPAAGSVLVAVSDPRTAAAEPGAPFAEAREPASIAKLITAAAAYRAGRDPDAAIARMTCTGVERYGGQPLWCPSPSGPLSGLDQALAQSCNVAFASVAAEVGAEAIEDEYRRWGFGANEDGARSSDARDLGRIHAAPHTPRELADLAIGLTLVDVTPLHAALIAAIVANGGQLAGPRLVLGASGPLGLTRSEEAAAATREVIEPGVARRLRQAMDAVVRYGTGAGLAPAGLAVAMKTGTAAELGAGYHVNYVGFLPGHSLAFCVRVTHERSSPKVTRAAREVTARLLQSLADRLAREHAAT